MKILYLVFVSVLTLYCSSCVSTTHHSYKQKKERYQKAMASDAIKNCSKNGGEVRNAGIMQLPHCVITYPDAGKACLSSSDCTGHCLLIEQIFSAGASTEGECQHNSLPFGCYARVEDGIASAAICVD